MQFEVLKVGTSTWNECRQFTFSNNLYKLGFPTYLDGAIHFLLMQDEYTDFILRFDVHGESFALSPSPLLKDRVQRFAQPNSSDRLTMGSLSHSLYICCYNSAENTINIWLMKESWSLLSHIKLPHLSAGIYKAVSFSKKLTWIYNETMSSLHSYDERGASVRTFEFRGATEFSLVDFEPSFGSLKHALKAYEQLEFHQLHHISREGPYNLEELYMEADTTQQFGLQNQNLVGGGDDLWVRDKHVAEQMMFEMEDI